MLLLKNALNSKFENLEVLIDNGVIIELAPDKIAERLKDNDDVEVVDVEGNVIMPTFVDGHFHLRNPGQEYKQTYEEANAALLKGGFSDVIALANTKPVCDNLDVIREIKENSDKLDINVFQVSSVTKSLAGKKLVNFEEMITETKFFSDDGMNIDDEEIMRRALLKSKELGFVIFDHSQPETEMVIRNVKLAEETGGNLHFCHLSRKGSLEAAISAIDKGLNVSFEVTPHHLFAENLSYRVNPPIATRDDIEAIIKAIKDGYVRYIGTDHAPHTDEDKKNGAPGISNIEYAFQMVYKVFDDFGISLETLEKLMCHQSGDMIGKNARIEVGAPADLVIISTEPSTIDMSNSVLRSKNSPFDGRETKGRVLKTFIGGRLVYNA